MPHFSENVCASIVLNSKEMRPGQVGLQLRYFHLLWVRDYRRGMDLILDLFTTCIHQSELHFTFHWHTQTSVLSLLVSTSHFLATASTKGNSSASRTQVLFVTAARAELLSTDNWTGSQTGGHFTSTSYSSLHRLTFNWQLTTALSHSPTSYFTSLHSTELLTTDNFYWKLKPTTNSLLQIVLLITSQHGPHRKHRYSIAALVFTVTETYLQNRCLETGCINPFFYSCLRVWCSCLAPGLYATHINQTQDFVLTDIKIRIYRRDRSVIFYLLCLTVEH
jgi:hypothetical protein